MGYSRSKQTIDRVRPVLDLVLGFDGVTPIKFPSNNPHKLCYTIRDALAVIKRMPSESKYNIIQEKYKIRIKDDHILFEPREDVHFSDPITELAIARQEQEMQITEAKTLIEVVGAVVQHKADSMIFSSAILSSDEFDRLQRWATLNNYKITDMEPLTLSRHEPKTNSSPQDGTATN